MLRLSLMFAAVIALSLSFGETASARKANPTAAEFQKALAIAQAEVPDGQLVKARPEQGGKIFGFYFWKNGKMHEIEINMTSLKVVKKVEQIDTEKVVSADVVKLVGQQKAAKAKLPEGRLLEIAADALKDSGVTDVKYSILDGKLVFQVGDLVLDAATGKPIGK